MKYNLELELMHRGILENGRRDIYNTLKHIVKKPGVLGYTNLNESVVVYGDGDIKINAIYNKKYEFDTNSMFLIIKLSSYSDIDTTSSKEAIIDYLGAKICYYTINGIYFVEVRNVENEYKVCISFYDNEAIGIYNSLIKDTSIANIKSNFENIGIEADNYFESIREGNNVFEVSSDIFCNIEKVIKNNKGSRRKIKKIGN